MGGGELEEEVDGGGRANGGLVREVEWRRVWVDVVV